MTRHCCHTGGYYERGSARRIGQQDDPTGGGDDTAMTTASEPYYVGGAQVTCPLCSTPLTVSTQPPATAGGTALSVARCPNCPWVMVGADFAPVRYVECSQADALAQFDAARLAFRPDERVALTVYRDTQPGTATS